MAFLSFPYGWPWGISRDAPPPPPESVRRYVRTDGRSYADVITTFFQLDGLPIFLTHGASLAPFARWSSAIKPWLPRTFRNLHNLKCYYDQILDINFFTLSNTIGVPKIPCQISVYYEQQNSCFLNLSFREFTAAIIFPFLKSGLRIGENNVIFSKIPHGLKL